MNSAHIMLTHAALKKKEQSVILPALRRQVAGNFENPYDLENYDNRDLKLFCQEYLRYYNRRPSLEEIEDVALFPADDNLLQLQVYFSKL